MTHTLLGGALNRTHSRNHSFFKFAGNEALPIQPTRDVTKFEFEFECCRISHNFTAFDIRRMLKLPSHQMRIS